ncbi:hypothetical protein OG21DRAFT_1519721 [Imleria badia]|nr:hypothetical protein OG21DRAFT_1519721 [Imleria badia]
MEPFDHYRSQLNIPEEETELLPLEEERMKLPHEAETKLCLNDMKIPNRDPSERGVTLGRAFITLGSTRYPSRDPPPANKLTKQRLTWCWEGWDTEMIVKTDKKTRKRERERRTVKRPPGGGAMADLECTRGWDCSPKFGPAAIGFGGCMPTTGLEVNGLRLGGPTETYPPNLGPAIAPGNNATQIGGPPLALTLGSTGPWLGPLAPSAPPSAHSYFLLGVRSLLEA